MAEALSASLYDNPDIKELLELLKSPGFRIQRKDYESLLDGVETIVKQYTGILTELDALKEKVSKITDRKNPLVGMAEHLESLASGIGEKLKSLKDGILSFTENALETVKEKGLSALGAVFGFLRVKDRLQSMSDGLMKSAAALNKAVARVNSLDRHNRDKVARHEIGETPEAEEEEEEPAVGLLALLSDTRMDFENLAPDELKAVYEKLLTIGIGNSLTADENDCLQYLVGEISELLCDHGNDEALREAEIETEQGEEM
jgi:hypothetical protein